MKWLEQVSGLLAAGGEPGGMLAVAQELLVQAGGLAGLVARFREAGFDAQTASWLGPGPNLPISPEQILTVLGQERLEDLAGKFGLDSNALARQLALHVPLLIDKMSPDGHLPKGCDALLTHNLGLLKNFLSR